MSSSNPTWTVHDMRCIAMFGRQNALPKEGSLQCSDEYRWHETETAWGDATQVIFPHKQKLLPPGRKDLLNSNTCEEFNAFIRQKRPEKFFGTLPSLSKDGHRCPGLVQSRSSQNLLISRRCSNLLQSWSQALMVNWSEGYTPFCMEHDKEDAHKELLAKQDAEFAKFHKEQQHQAASAAADTSAALSSAVVPSSVASEANSKKRSNSSEREAPLRKHQRSSRQGKRSPKLSPSEQDKTSVTALADQVAPETSQAGMFDTGVMTNLSILSSMNPATALTSTAVPPASTSQAAFVKPAIPFDPDVQLPCQDQGFTSIPSSAESNNLSDGHYGWFLDPQPWNSQIDLNAFTKTDDIESLGARSNDWEIKYEAVQSQHLDYMSFASPDNGNTGSDQAHQKADPSL